MEVSARSRLQHVARHISPAPVATVTVAPDTHIHYGEPPSSDAPTTPSV